MGTAPPCPWMMVTHMQYGYDCGSSWVFITCSMGAAVDTLDWWSHTCSMVTQHCTTTVLL